MSETALAVMTIAFSVGSIVATTLSIYLDWRWS